MNDTQGNQQQISVEQSVQRILVIASDPEEQSTVVNMVLGHGYEVKAYTCFDAEAEAELHKTVFDLIILAPDAMGVTSSEICSRLKTHKNTEEIPILLIVEENDLAGDIASGLPGVADFLRKPYDRRTLLARVNVLLTIEHQEKELALLNRQLIEAQKTECLGSLAAGIVHEINNLMFPVMGYADIALSSGESDIEALRESAEISYETAKRATACAGSLLAFTRQARSTKEIASVNDVVNSALRLLRKDLNKSGIVMELDLREIPNTRLSMGSMQQVFLNLIINAWHAMMESDGERKLTIASRCENESRIIVTVTDTGIGIEAKNLKRIFEPFYTSKTETNGQGVIGSGLGMTVISEVVRDHDGRVDVESHPGKCTRFTISLPVDQTHSEDDRDPEDETQVMRKCSVLIVDDEEPSRKVLTRMLLKRGHQARSAASMAEAMPLLWGDHIDLIVMDMVMPTGDGATNTRQLRDDGVETPILICTGHADNAALTRALEAGADGVIMKPFSAREFLAEMKRCLEIRKTPSASGIASGACSLP